MPVSFVLASPFTRTVLYIQLASVPHDTSSRAKSPIPYWGIKNWAVGPLISSINNHINSNLNRIWTYPPPTHTPWIEIYRQEEIQTDRQAVCLVLRILGWSPLSLLWNLCANISLRDHSCRLPTFCHEGWETLPSSPLQFCLSGKDRNTRVIGAPRRLIQNVGPCPHLGHHHQFYEKQREEYGVPQPVKSVHEV